MKSYALIIKKYTFRHVLIKRIIADLCVLIKA